MAHHEDRFCRRRTWSDFIREVGSGGGGQLRRPRDLLIPTLIYRKIFYIEQRFFTSGM
jgi:hypothetical protein